MPLVIPWWIWAGGGAAVTGWLMSDSEPSTSPGSGLDNGVAVNFSPGGLAVLAGGLVVAAYLVSNR
ncbi:MAG: hypothetical protein OQL08_01485 [Gammaproteobacteria bacterium]|nr:hypothetical protein [Gammaproteobacteria bacterium]